SFNNELVPFDMSSMVHLHSASLHLPDTFTDTFLPKRSAPYLLHKAPLGGLHTLSAQRMR
ncbi:MAG: hypothetical protein ACR2KX_11345, partial [Chitinophagaceae bacterium]